MFGFAAAVLLAQASAASDPAAAGIKALEVNDYPAAVAAFEKAVAAGPADYAAHFHLGLAHSLAGNAPGAEAAYRRTLELKPGLYEAELNLGQVLLGARKAAAAVPHLESASSKKPREFRPVYYLAEALAESGNPAAAEGRYRTALEIDPNSAAARAGLGRALARTGKHKEAEAVLRQAGDRDGLLELASLYEQAKDRDAAIAIYLGILASHGPDAAAVEERVGGILLEQGRAADAIPHLEAAVGQSPTSANRYALATAYLRDKQQGKALQTMEQAVNSDQTNPGLRLAYAGMQRDQRNFPAAAQQFWKATQLKADSKEAWTGLATMLLSLENYPQAIAAFDKLESLGEPNAGVYFLRALALDKMQQYKPALDNYRKFLELSQSRNPDEEFKARQRVKVIEKELSKR
jgi:tetratricopeptide (TPR) repeat protein